ncbi:MAG: aminoacyl-tRNA hydrolase [Salinivirgaceae bacterium]|nr:aminoacyl-tRNA hydrolase [Salinivirgaceae bacterium]MDD4746634.1 aminoacyl-tRNA hydrolase [Salinivirgaceae bacterium]MDY0279778.1 aminoacyl-tRNA hydrolase [Salinivirgaceae bacterium]
MKYLIVGLGNIGEEYKNTRHNIGFNIVDAIAEKTKTTFQSGRYGSLAIAKIKGRQLFLLKPSTYMNLSGNAVRYWMQMEKIPLENVLIIADDIALPLGKVRLRMKGSDAGHNGFKHIIEVLGTDAFARLRFGIGDDFPKGFQVDFVLGNWSPEESTEIEKRLSVCVEATQCFVMMGIQKAMNEYNNK